MIELPRGAGVPSALPTLPPAQRAAMEERLADADPSSAMPSPRARPTATGSGGRTRFWRWSATAWPSTVPDGTPRAFAMGARERDEAVDSPLYVRGELDQPGEVVPRGLVRVLCDGPPDTIAAGSGRRELADWLASSANPLTARVIVNRVWLHLFGRGLVPTPDNFGAAGQPPSHPELLDTLAVDFMADGWSIKRLIRRIVLSRAYRLDSAHDPHNFEVDPDDALVWRMSPRRLDAEAIRDAMLFVGGRLAPEPPVGSAVARAGEGLALFVRTAGLDASDTHRSVYLPVIRDRVLEPLALFDFADPSLVTGERATTTGPAQALYFLNGPFVIRQAEALAERAPGRRGRRPVQDRPGLSARLRSAADGRGTRPRPRLPAATSPRDDRRPTRRVRPWSAFCQALFAAAEFRYLD